MLFSLLALLGIWLLGGGIFLPNIAVSGTCFSNPIGSSAGPPRYCGCSPCAWEENARNVSPLGVDMLPVEIDLVK